MLFHPCNNNKDLGVSKIVCLGWFLNIEHWHWEIFETRAIGDTQKIRQINLTFSKTGIELDDDKCALFFKLTDKTENSSYMEYT